MAQLVAPLNVSRCVAGPCGAEHFGFPPSAPRLGTVVYSHVYVTGHIKDPVPLIKKRRPRGLSPGGRFPPSFIHQVIIITRLNKLYNRMFSP